MLERLYLENFRGFERHEVPFRPLTVIVGPNNAGKSTIAEALRLVALVTTRLGAVNFRDPPRGLELGRFYRGFSPDLDRTEFDFTSAFHNYGDPPAKIDAQFANGTRIEIYIGGQDLVHAVTFAANGAIAGTKSQAAAANVPRVSACPQVGPLALEESVLRADYVRRTMDTPRSSQHLRNQLFRTREHFDVFRTLMDDLWPGIRVRELTLERDPLAVASDDRGELQLLMQEASGFVAEASKFGHGLQVCLQIAWFIVRADVSSTIVLDEPDVYLHPDVQRRLFRAVRARFRQCIVATHSAEIMADAAPEDVLVVNKASLRSNFATSLPAVQDVIDQLGGVHNLSLAKLANSRRFVLVEGEDLSLLAPIHRTLFPKSVLDLRDIPSGEVGGWSGWERVVGAASAMRNALGERMQTYAIFDSDYYPNDVILNRHHRAREHGVALHIWTRKELENYLLVPSAIARVIHDRALPGALLPNAEDIESKIESIAQGLRADAVATMGDAIFNHNKKGGVKDAVLAATRIADELWLDPDNRWGIVSGKRVISELSNWSKDTHGVSFGAGTIARALTASEVSKELAAVLGSIETGSPF